MSSTAFVRQTGVMTRPALGKLVRVICLPYGLEVSGYVRNTKKIVLYHFVNRERPWIVI
jgi:hypothetical protein